ncbi:MAG: hypothetical protein J7L15_06675 [Clostridiales bacterium]|nr:hypothetical protein [Clostridiales bacterium]
MFNWLKEVKKSFFNISFIEENKPFIKESVEKLEKERGTYQTFLKCQSCNYIWEVTVPKGCRYYNEWGYKPMILDEKTKNQWDPTPVCNKCDTTNIRHVPDIVK